MYMNTGESAEGASIADAEQSAAKQLNGETKVRAGQRGFAALGLLALIPFLCNIMAIPQVGERGTSWGYLMANFYILASLLMNPATALLGVIVARRLGKFGARRMAQLGSLLAMIALVPMFTWEYDILWPLYLGCGMTLVAAALIVGSSIFDSLNPGAAIKPSNVRANRWVTVVRAVALTVGAGAALGLIISSAKEAQKNDGVIYPYRVLEDSENDSGDWYNVASVAYSGDGQVLTAVEVTYLSTVRQERVWMWRTSDWQRVGTVEPGQTRGTISWDPQTMLVAERTDGGSELSLSDTNGALLHTVKLSGNGGKLKPGYSFSPSLAFGGGGLLTVPSGKVIKLSSLSFRSDSTRPFGNNMFFDYAPDGQYIAAAYEFGGVWIWKLP